MGVTGRESCAVQARIFGQGPDGRQFIKVMTILGLFELVGVIRTCRKNFDGIFPAFEGFFNVGREFCAPESRDESSVLFDASNLSGDMGREFCAPDALGE